jgi:hypothetical protein
MALKQPPHVNGIDETLTEDQILAIQADLQAIQTAFCSYGRTASM